MYRERECFQTRLSGIKSMDKREGATKTKVAGRGALLFMYPLHIACFYYFNYLGFVLSLSKGGGGGGHAGNTGVF